MREVSRARAAFVEAESTVREMMTLAEVRGAQVSEEIPGLLGEIRAHFDSLLGEKSRLSRRDKGRARRVLAEVLELLGPDEVVILRAPDEDERGREPQHEGEAGWAHPVDAARSDRAGARGGHHGRRGAASEAGPSAERPDAAPGSALRAAFRRLTVALHPDKVQDEAEKAQRTDLMKQVTLAFQSGDVGRLLELERTLLASRPPGDDPEALARRLETLGVANAELLRQLRKLTAERAALVQALPLPVRRGGASTPIRERLRVAVEGAIAETEAHVKDLRTIRDFARRFAEGKMAMAEFLSGPDLEGAGPR